MTKTSPFRLNKTGMLLLAALLVFICSIPSFVEAPSVSGQGVPPFCQTGYVSNGSSCVFNGRTTTGISCGTYISYSGTCSGQTSGISCGTYTSYSGTCSGQTSGINCGTSTSYGGATCATGGTGSCLNIRLAAGQSCSGGVITCAGATQAVTAGAMCSVGGTVSAKTTPYTTSAGGTASTTAASSAVANPAGTVSCPLGGTAASLSQCPQRCPDGHLSPAGQPCTAASSSASLTSTSAAVNTSTTAGASTGPCGSAATPTTSAAGTTGLSASYTSGWNLIGGPSGTVAGGASGSLFTFQSGDSNYEQLSVSAQLKGGQGYWACFPSNATSPIPAVVTGGSMTVDLPAGEYVMIGNPGDTVATVAGADTVLAYNVGLGYTGTTSLPVGAGAWAMSNGGGQAIITNAPPGS